MSVTVELCAAVVTGFEKVAANEVRLDYESQNFWKFLDNRKASGY